MNLKKYLLAISLLLSFSIPTVTQGQGGFLRVHTEYDLPDFQYSTPWENYFNFDTKTSYQIGVDIGNSVFPRNSLVCIRYSAGLQYQYVNLAGKIKSDVYNREFILNSAFNEVYDFIALPLRVEVLVQPRTYQPASYAYGLAGSLCINKPMTATSDVTMTDGTTLNKDIGVRDFLVSGSIGAVLDLSLTRYIVFELYGGYHVSFSNLLTADKASLYLNYTEISARLKFDMFRRR
jgi:hypothetical protein